MGNNIKLPDSISPSIPSLFGEEDGNPVGGNGASPVGTDAMIKAYKERQQKDPEAGRLEDAFQPVRRLVGQADPIVESRREQKQEVDRQQPLIAPEIYEHFQGETASVWSRISVRSSNDRWGFFCLRGQERRAPRWIFLERGRQTPTPGRLHFERDDWSVETRLSSIARRLRERIPESKPIDHLHNPKRWVGIEGEIETMIRRIQTNEWELLSNKSRHGLDLLQNALYRYRTDATPGSERYRVCSFLQKATDPDQEPAVNLHELADEWLGIVQPLYVAWKQEQAAMRRRDPVRLKDLITPLRRDPLSTDLLNRLAESVQAEEPIRRRVVAAIVAIPSLDSSSYT